MLKKYIEGLSICILILSIIAVLWGFFGALIVGIPWTTFWVGLIGIVISGPVAYAVMDDD